MRRGSCCFGRPCGVRMAVEDSVWRPQGVVIAMPPRMRSMFWVSRRASSRFAQPLIYLPPRREIERRLQAFGAARRTAKEGGSLLPPKHILNSPTKLEDSRNGYGSVFLQYGPRRAGKSPLLRGRDYFRKRSGGKTFKIRRTDAVLSAKSASGWIMREVPKGSDREEQFRGPI